MGLSQSVQRRIFCSRPAGSIAIWAAEADCTTSVSVGHRSPRFTGGGNMAGYLDHRYRESIGRDGCGAQPIPIIHTISRVHRSAVVTEVETRTGRTWRLGPPRGYTFWSDRSVNMTGTDALVIVFLEQSGGG